MRSRLWRRLGLTLVLASCTRPPVVPVPLVPATEADPTIEIRNGSLSNGFITVQLQLRRGLTGPRPVVISPITDDAWLLEAGAMLATYTVHWEQLRPLTQGTPAAAPASGRSYGKWLLTSPTADKVGSGYFAFIDYTA